MIRNAVIVIIRNLKSRGFYSFLNIFGLSVGIVCCLLIMLWVLDELSYNKFIPKHERLYEVWINADLDGKIESWPTVPLPTYEAVKAADHRIANSAVVGRNEEKVLMVNETKISKQGCYVSEEFLQMFEFPLLQGDAATVLDGSSSIVLTASTAHALFGDEDPIDKMVKVDNQHMLKVTGVLRDIPQNSSLQFDFLMSWRHGELTQKWIANSKHDWASNLFFIYVELKSDSDSKDVAMSVKDILSKNNKGQFKQEFFLYPMDRWRLHGNFENGQESGGIIDYVNLFLIIAALILIMGCVNFTNLMTARSERSAKEVGIRKTLGASAANLKFRFLGESLVVTILAFFLGIIITILVLPYYNTLVEKSLSLNIFTPSFWVLSVGIVVFTAVLSGSYPAFYLSSFSPITTLKGKLVTGKGAGVLRKILVVLQLVAAILLLAGTWVNYQQIDLMKSRSLGYLKDKLITVKYNDGFRKNYNVIEQELLQSGAIESMTKSNASITEVINNNLLDWPGKPSDQKIMFVTVTTQYDYTKTMGIKMLQGRDFSRDVLSDSNAIIVNKAALDIMKLKEPVGTTLDLWGTKRNLVGIMDDVVMESVEAEVRPLFMIFADWGGVVTIRLNQQKSVESSINEIESVFKSMNAEHPFEYEFVDVSFARKFQIISLIQKLANLFTMLAVAITCLGLYGLISYVAEQRTKEIGIRKVLGASIINLILLLCKDFSKLVLIAFLVASPITWWLLEDYLHQYPIRVYIAWWLIPLAGVFILLLTLVIVIAKASRAAKVDPVITLRTQ